MEAAAFKIVEFDNTSHRDQVDTLWRTVFGYQDARNRPGLVIDKKLAVQDGLFFVAVRGKRVLGTIMAGYDGHRGWIYSLAVDPKQRRHGIGSKLLAYAERQLTSRGCVKVNLQILGDNAALQRFYQRSGFATENRISMGKQIEANIEAP